MRFVKIIVMLILFMSFWLLSTLANANPNDSIKISKGVVYIGGKVFDRQVYLQTNSEIIQLTNFQNWEEIFQISVSGDKQFLLVYHKTNKESSRKFSTYDLQSFKLIRSMKPGYGGSIQWTKNNNILQIWGCGSPCGCFRIFDWNLNELTSYCGTVFKDFPEEDIIISIPFLSIEEGKFKIWSLKSGKKIKDLDFRSKYGDYYCQNAWIVEGQIAVELSPLANQDLTVTEYIPIDQN